jgi:NADH dehydrogenase (ubiquinone) 1 beta subcomplex subunit 7
MHTVNTYVHSYVTVMIATIEEMQAMNVEVDKRDYCAHRWIEFMKCRDDKHPFYAKCAHEKHVWEECQYQE